MDILQQIKTSYPSLTRKQKSIADYLLANPGDICYITLAKLSEVTSASELTLLRFCKKIGCENFLELKDLFRDYNQNMIKLVCAPEYFIPERPEGTTSEKEALLLGICSQEASMMNDFIANINLEHIINAADEIKKSQRIYIFAHDISRIPGEFLESRLRLLYFNATLVYLSDLSATQQTLQDLTEGDLVIFFSFPKYYYPVGSVAKQASESGVPIITISDSDTAPTAKYSKHILRCQTATKMFYNSLTLPMAMINLLASCLVIDMVPSSERQDFMDTLQS